jgi:hypothetical protein
VGINGYFIGGYWWSYFINGCYGYWWLLMVIGGYYINGY